MPTRQPKLSVALAVLCSLAWLVGCGDRTPTRDTPEGAIAAARYVVEHGRADRLSKFIYADSPDMRALYDRLGVMLRNTQKLGEAVQKRFPDEIASLTAQAEDAAKKGQATGLLSQISGAMQRQNQRGRAKSSVSERDARQDAFNAAVARLFADPYGFLRDSEGRLTTTFLTDTTVALLWDKQPIMPPIGMIMQKDADGLWYFVLPTNLPGVNNFMPKTKEQFQIWGGLISIFDKVVIDLREDVDKNRVRTLEELSQRAGEKIFLPAAMAFYAYEQLRRDQSKAVAKPG